MLFHGNKGTIIVCLLNKELLMFPKASYCFSYLWITVRQIQKYKSNFTERIYGRISKWFAIWSLQNIKFILVMQWKRQWKTLSQLLYSNGTIHKGILNCSFLKGINMIKQRKIMQWTFMHVLFPDHWVYISFNIYLKICFPIHFFWQNW